MNLRGALLGLAIAAAGAIAAAAGLAPYLFAELSPVLSPHVIVDPAPARLAKGRMADDYFAVEAIGPGTFAIGEPRYYQQNYAYLILGRDRAVLFDAGSGTRDIRPVVSSLTSLPVMVIPSHLHFDHLGGAAAFGSVALIDLPATRADVRAGVFRPKRYEYLGFIDGRSPPELRVTRWLAPGSSLDLGGRTLEVLSTPGHTPTSIALFDPAQRALFIGDYIYPTTLYAFLPGASLSAYRRAARALLARLPPETRLWTAHCCRRGEGIAAPWLSVADLRDLAHALDAAAKGRIRPVGFYPRIFPVNREMTLATGFAWNNR